MSVRVCVCERQKIERERKREREIEREKKRGGKRRKRKVIEGGKSFLVTCSLGWTLIGYSSSERLGNLSAFLAFAHFLMVALPHGCDEEYKCNEQPFLRANSPVTLLKAKAEEEDEKEEEANPVGDSKAEDEVVDEYDGNNEGYE